MTAPPPPPLPKRKLNLVHFWTAALVPIALCLLLLATGLDRNMELLILILLGSPILGAVLSIPTATRSVGLGLLIIGGIDLLLVGLCFAIVFADGLHIK